MICFSLPHMHMHITRSCTLLLAWAHRIGSSLGQTQFCSLTFKMIDSTRAVCVSFPKIGGTEETGGISQKVEAGHVGLIRDLFMSISKRHTSMQLLHQIVAALIKTQHLSRTHTWIYSAPLGADRVVSCPGVCVISCVEAEPSSGHPVGFLKLIFLVCCHELCVADKSWSKLFSISNSVPPGRYTPAVHFTKHTPYTHRHAHTGSTVPAITAIPCQDKCVRIAAIM